MWTVEILKLGHFSLVSVVESCLAGSDSETLTFEKMADRPGLKLPSSTPLLSWFEFLLDKSGDLLKNHVKSSNPGIYLSATISPISKVHNTKRVILGKTHKSIL